MRPTSRPLLFPGSWLLCLALLLPFACTGEGGTKDPGDVLGDADGDVDFDGDADLSGECEGMDCGVGGVCTPTGLGYGACSCYPGYHNDGAGGACVPDDPCADVTCGEGAFCDLGTCRCLEGYEGNPYDVCEYVPTEEDACRAGLVAIAEQELGYCEGVDERPYMLGQPGLWCYDFVAWVYDQSSCAPPTPLYLPRRTVGSLPNGWRPAPGDLIKFTIQHYGMVAAVSPDGQVITTIEGNVNSCVMSRTTSDPSVEYYGTLEDVW